MSLTDFAISIFLETVAGGTWKKPIVLQLFQFGWLQIMKHEKWVVLPQRSMKKTWLFQVPGVYVFNIYYFSPPPKFHPLKTPPQGPLPSDSLRHKAPENGMHHELWTSWWFQPIWKICSSNWIISPSKGVNNRYLKPRPSETCLIFWHTLPKTNSKFAPENRPVPKRKQSYSNHPFSGENSLLLSGRVPPEV